jgi:hypothetical protein
MWGPWRPAGEGRAGSGLEDRQPSSMPVADDASAMIERAQRGRQRHGLSTDVTSTSRPCADGYEVQEAARVDQTTGARGHARRFEHELGGLVLPAAVAQGLGDVLG